MGFVMSVHYRTQWIDWLQRGFIEGEEFIWAHITEGTGLHSACYRGARSQTWLMALLFLRRCILSKTILELFLCKAANVSTWYADHVVQLGLTERESPGQLGRHNCPKGQIFPADWKEKNCREIVWGDADQSCFRPWCLLILWRQLNVISKFVISVQRFFF